MALEKKFGASIASLRKNSNADPANCWFRIGFEIDYTACDAPKLGRIRSRLHREFQDGLQGDIEVVPASFRGGSYGNSVHQEQIGFGALAVHVDGIGRPSFARGSRIDSALRAINCCQLRPLSGISATAFSEMTCEICAPSVESSCVPVASLRTESVTWPTARQPRERFADLKNDRAEFFDFESRLGGTQRVGAGNWPGVRYRPSLSFDSAKTSTPVSFDRIRIFACGTKAWETSRTSPRNTPPEVWAEAALGSRTATNKIRNFPARPPPHFFVPASLLLIGRTGGSFTAGCRPARKRAIGHIKAVQKQAD